MHQQTFYVDKIADTSADTLLAVGFGFLARTALLNLGKMAHPMMLRDRGDYLEIALPAPLSSDELARLEPFTLVAPLMSGKQSAKAEKQGQVLSGFDYDLERRKRDEYRALLQQLPKHLQQPGALLGKAPELEEIANRAPSDILDHYILINQMIVAGTFNGLATRWTGLPAPAFTRLVRLLFERFSATPNREIEALAD